MPERLTRSPSTTSGRLAARAFIDVERRLLDAYRQQLVLADAEL